MEIKISVPGDPKTQARHRTFRRGENFVGSYDPSANDKKDFLALAFAYKPDKPLEGPLCMTISLYYPRPKNHFCTGKKCNILKPVAPKFHASRPDVDNCYKFVSDSLNSVFYKDDSQICMLQVVKMYSDCPRTEILIETL